MWFDGLLAEAKPCLHTIVVVVLVREQFFASISSESSSRMLTTTIISRHFFVEVRAFLTKVYACNELYWKFLFHFFNRKFFSIVIWVFTIWGFFSSIRKRYQLQNEISRRKATWIKTRPPFISRTASSKKSFHSPFVWNIWQIWRLFCDWKGVYSLWCLAHSCCRNFLSVLPLKLV